MPKSLLFLALLLFTLPAFAQKRVIHMRTSKGGIPYVPKNCPANASNLIFEYSYPNPKPAILSVPTFQYLSSPRTEYKTEEHLDFLKGIEGENIRDIFQIEIYCPQKDAPKRQTYEVLKGFQELGKLDSLKGVLLVELDENFAEMPKVFDILASLPKLGYAHFSGKSAQAFAEQFLKLQQLTYISLSYDDYTACLPNVLTLPKLKTLRLDYSPELKKGNFLDKAGHLESIILQIYWNKTPHPCRARRYARWLKRKLPNTQVYVY